MTKNYRQNSIVRKIPFKRRPLCYMVFILTSLGHVTPSLGVVETAQESVPPADGATVELGGVEVKASRIKAPRGSAGDGYRVDKVSVGPLGESSGKETPYSISTVSGDMIENTMATNTTEALKYLPTVQSNTGGSQITPYFTIRGFSASTWTYNMALDGMRSFDVYQPMEDKERIDVLNGANSFLYGITNPAGIINYVLKRPADTPMARLTLGNYDQQFYTHLDTGGPVKGILNNKLNYRLNLLYGTPGDTGVEHQTQERYLASGALDWHVGKDTTVSLDASWSKRNLDYAQALFMPSTKSGIPSAPDASKNWGAPYTGAWDSTTRVGLGLTSRLNDIFSLRSNFRFTDIKREFSLNRQVWQNNALDYKWRVDSNSPFYTDVIQYGLYTDAEFSTGPLNHKFTFGGSLDHFDAGNNGYRGTTYATVYPSNLYGAASYRPYSLPPRGTSTSQKTTYNNVLVADNIGFGEHWSLLAGGNWSRVDDSLTSLSAKNVKTVAAYDDNAFTPTVALSFKPVKPVTAYFSYGQGLQQGAAVPTGSVNAGQVFAPFVSEQLEFGIKTEIGRMNVNTALFRIEQANQYTTGSGSSTVYHQDGKAIHQGIELTISGKATDDLTLNGGFTFLDAKVDKAASAALQGKVPQGVAEEAGKLYVEYALPFVPGLTLTGGMSYTGKTWVNAANTLSVPAIVTADAGLRYERNIFGHDTVMRLNISNLTGEDYWTTRSGILYLGSPRIVSGSVTIAMF
jgi:iron complex outermembrane recepter protein